MQAGLLFAPGGPWILAGLGLAFVFVTFRRPLWGIALSAAWAGFASFVTAEPTLQAIGSTLCVLVLGAAALARRGGSACPCSDPLDKVMAAIAGVVGIAAVQGWVAQHSRSLLLGDLYHFLVLGPALYFACRGLVGPGEVATAVRGIVLASVAWSIAAVSVVAFSGDHGELMWLAGAPLDEGGLRLDTDFGIPLVALTLTIAHLARRGPSWREVAFLPLATALVLTYKRTLWGAALLAAGMLFVDEVRKRRVRPRAWVWMGVMGLGALGLAALAGLNVESALRRGGELARPTTAATFQSRVPEWRAAVSAIVQKPLGHGLGATLPVPSRRDEGRTHHIHNMFLQWGFQAGVQMVLLMFLATWFLLRGHPRAGSEQAGLRAALVALLCAGTTVLSFYSLLAAVIFALGAAERDDASRRYLASTSF